MTECGGFNDATSVFKYHHIYKDRRHESINFKSHRTAVKAMDGGVVIETRVDWQTGGDSAGRYIKIHSCTDRDGRSGFEHAYLYLESVTVAVGDTVTKGQQLGTSGEFHLHVHLRPFDREGKVPSPRENSAKPPRSSQSE